MEERIITNHKLDEDVTDNIRPSSIDEYIGQSDVKENLKVCIKFLNNSKYQPFACNLVRWFSNLNKGVKIIMIFLTLVVWIASLLLVYSYISYKHKCRKWNKNHLKTK